MRPLTFEEAKIFFLKMVKYKKGNLHFVLKEKILFLIVFRIQKLRIFETLIGITGYVNHFREHQIASLGTCIARYTHTKKLRLNVPFLKLITEFPPSNSLGCTRHGESQFLRGVHLTRANLGWTNGNIVRGEGVFIVGTTGIKLGFGEVISSIQFFQNSNYQKIIVANQGDIGSYTRIYNYKKKKIENLNLNNYLKNICREKHRCLKVIFLYFFLFDISLNYNFKRNYRSLYVEKINNPFFLKNTLKNNIDTKIYLSNKKSSSFDFVYLNSIIILKTKINYLYGAIITYLDLNLMISGNSLIKLNNNTLSVFIHKKRGFPLKTAMNLDESLNKEIYGEKKINESYGNPGKTKIKESEIIEREKKLKSLAEVWKRERIVEEESSRQLFGFTKNSEVLNGRLAMFFLITGLLTEIWTKQTIIGQIDTMLRIIGLV